MTKKILIALTLFTNCATAQWLVDTSKNTPICTIPGKQGDPRIMEDGNGGCFIAWKDWRNNNVPDIFIQYLDKDGIANWTVNGLNVCTNSADQSTPNICPDEAGGVIVTWSDFRTGIERDIYAQRINKEGVSLWTFNGAPVTDKNNREHNEKICSDGMGGAYFSWEEQLAGKWRVYAQHLDSNGNRLWGNGGIPVTTVAGNRINPKIQADKKHNGAFITWQDERSGSYDIYAQKVDSLGNLLWSNNGLLVCGANNEQTLPKIDPDPSIGGVYICWVDKRNNLDYDLYAQRIDSNGNVLWAQDGMPVVQNTFNQSAQDIISNNNVNGLIVTWKDKRGSSFDIYAQKLDKNGNQLWGNGGKAVCAEPLDQINPSISGDKSNGVIITWQTSTGVVLGDNIKAQRLDANGNALWANNGIIVSKAVGEQAGPKNIPDGGNGTIIVWEDDRNPADRDIYAHHLNGSGVSYPVKLSSTLIKPNNFGPNPFTNYVNFEVQKINNELPEITLTDIQGRVVASSTIILVDNGDNATLKLTPNTSLNAGVYFAVLHKGGIRQTVKIIKD